MNHTIFDCNCMLGPRADGNPDEPSSLEQLRENMDYYGIQRALVSSATARDYSAPLGNEELATAISEEDNLGMVWTIDPITCIREPERAMVTLDKYGAQATICYPKMHNYSLASWSLGNWLSLQEERQVPLLLPRDQADWIEIHALCEEHPKLPIILTRISYREIHYLYALWSKYKNLHIDIAWLSIHRGLEAIAKAGFLDQVIFGSYYPYYCPGSALGILEYANLNNTQKTQVACSTLENLLASENLL